MRLHQVRGTRPVTVVVALAIALAAPAALTPPAASAAQPSTPTSQEGALQAPASEIIPDRYIVTIEADATNSEVREVRNDATADGAQVHHTYTEALNGFAATMSPEELASFRAEHPDARITADRTVHAFELPQGLDRIDQRRLPLDGGFSLSGTGDGVTAYVIDTGIRASHQEFTGRVMPGFSSFNTGDSRPEATNDCTADGHGTHVAGTLGGRTFGVAPGVRIVPVKVLDCRGVGSFSGVAAGVDWVTQEHQRIGGPSVANMSLGGVVNSDTAVVGAAIVNAVAAGVTFVVAAGNENSDACNATPANVEAAIAVGATEFASSGTRDERASYSNFGRCVDIWAPGTNILSATNSSNSASGRLKGTSMASPHVAGALATYLQFNRGATPAEARQILLGSATPNAISDIRSGSPNLMLFAKLTLPGPNQAPVVPTPTAVLIEGRSARSGAPVKVVLGRATDPDGDPIDRVELEASTDGGANWGRVPLGAQTPTSIALVLQSPTTLFRTRAFDDRGLVGVSITSAPVVLRTVDQSVGTAFAARSAWKRKASSSALAGSSARSAKKNATARFTFTGRQISWIARTNDAFGKAAVFIDGVRVDTVNLYSDDNSYRRVVFASGVLGAGRHTITVKVLGKKSGDSDGKAVDVDGWIVRS